MTFTTESQIVFGAVGTVLAANTLAYGLHVARNGLPEGKAEDAVQKMVNELDRVADNMSNPEKRRAAIQQIAIGLAAVGLCRLAG